jgi:hypothetical protein
MKIINKVTETSYIQWIEGFVKTVLEKAEIQCNEVAIEDIEFSKRIFLIIDGEEYSIRTWSFHPIGTDANGETCAENVDYTLYEMVNDEAGSHGENISDGSIKIEWKNSRGSMDKNYNNMTDEELEKEFADIVKKNYEKGVLLLDHNFSIKKLREFKDVSNVENPDDIISILRSMKKIPDMRKYFLKDTDVLDYRLIHINNGKAVEILSFPRFSNEHDEIMEMYLTDKLKDISADYGEYPIVQMLNGKFIGTVAVMFYSDNPFLDCVEHDFHIMCENAYGTKDVYIGY